MFWTGAVHPESSEVGGVVTETSQDSVRGVSCRAADRAPVLQTVVPENTGEVVQTRPVQDLWQRDFGKCVSVRSKDKAAAGFLTVGLNSISTCRGTTLRSGPLTLADRTLMLARRLL